MTDAVTIPHAAPHTEWAGIVVGNPDEGRKWTKVSARHSTWTGEILRQKMAAVGVGINQFARMTGANRVTVSKWLAGKYDGDIPLWIELVLELLERCPDTRHRGRGRPGRPRIEGEAREPPDFPPPRAKRWPEMERALETAKPTVTTMTDDELLAEYQVYDAMDELSSDDTTRFDAVVEECLKRRIL